MVGKISADGQRERYGWLVLLGAICAVGPLSIDLYLPGAPSIAAEFSADKQIVQFTVVSYLIGLLLGQLCYGPVSDRIGRKAPLLAGIGLYTVCSALSTMSNGVGVLVALRFFQGLGGCAGMVIARAIIRDRTGTNGAARAFSLLMLIVSAAPLLAPLLGASLLERWGWRSMFAFMTIFGACCFTAVFFNLRETMPSTNREKPGWNQVLGDYNRLFRDPQFLNYTVCNGLAQGGMYAYIAGSSFVLIDLYGLTPGQYSLMFGLNSLGMIVAAQINVRLLSRFTPQKIMGTTLAVIGTFSFIALFFAGTPSVMVFFFGLFLFLSSIGLIAPNAAAVALESQGNNAGTASALLGTILSALGALFGFITSLLGDGTAKPLIVVVSASGISAAVVYLFARMKHRQLRFW
jgi:DHA1 family bicyclomycin/chloramphenicol resistance-like MFS transporter